MIGAYLGDNHTASRLVARCNPKDWDEIEVFVFHPSWTQAVPITGFTNALTWDALNVRPEVKLIEEPPPTAKYESSARLSKLLVPQGYLKTTTSANYVAPQSLLAINGNRTFRLVEHLPTLKNQAVAIELIKQGDGWTDPQSPVEERIELIGCKTIAAEKGVDGIWRKILDAPQQPIKATLALHREARVAQPLIEKIVMALKGEDVVTRSATPREVTDGLWEEADAKAILKLVAGPNPVIGNTKVRRKDVDFACGLVMVRNWHLDPEGNVIAQKSRAAADGRNDPRDVDGHIALPDVTLHRLVMLYGLSRKEIRISDVTSAYPHATMDPKYTVAVRMPGRLPKAIRDLGFEQNAYYPVLRNYYG